MPQPKRCPELRIENLNGFHFVDDKEAFLASIAVSLKRIADAVTGDDKRLGLMDVLSVGLKV